MKNIVIIAWNMASGPGHLLFNFNHLPQVLSNSKIREKH